MDDITLTPNRRLAATLHKQYAESQEGSCWQRPEILPLNSWLQKCWLNYTLGSFKPEPYLLNAVQEHFLWEKIIAASKESHQLLQVHETAELVKAAYKLLKEWRVDVQHHAFQSAEDYAALATWIREYQSLCKKNNWIDQASLADKLPTLISLPKRVRLVGFTELSPQMHYLFANTEKYHDQHQPQAKVGRITLADAEEELLTLARWAKATQQTNPDARIACVVPELEKNRDRVAQVFAEVFGSESVYNISAGKQLIQYPIIDVALQLLMLFKKKTSDATFSYLLTSPFLGEAECESARRGIFDVYLRRENISTIQLDTLLEESLSKICPRLAKRLSKFFAHIEALPKEQSYTQWTVTFNELLSICGWPGERSLSSEEYQVVENWMTLLAQFATLDQVAPPPSFQPALTLLCKMAAKTIFQPKSPESPVQILGVLEAAGIDFDFVWVTGMNDVAWPPQPKPNPFIPKSLQRELNMPHATAEREYMFCSAIIHQFKCCAKELIFSYAERADDLEFKESPLIHVEHEYNLTDLSLPDYFSPTQAVLASSQWETLIDEHAPPVAENKIAGGISIIKYQAACPFRAFAEWRLHAQQLESPLPGLRPKDRGNVVHKALELIWCKLKDQQALMNMATTDLMELITLSVDEAMLALPRSHIGLKHYISLEKTRLQKILHDWLQVEKTRPPFRVVQNELKVEYKLRQLAITMRIDRIDEIEGRKLIIDYKTGATSVNAWFENRLDDPQLPLYALIDPDNTIGICFAQISAGEHGFRGVSQHELEIKGIKKVEANKKAAASWQEQIEAWQMHLTQLADDFTRGIATVDPKDPDQTCQYCALEPLCRKNEEIADAIE